MTAPVDLTAAPPPVRPWASRPAAPDQFPELQRHQVGLPYHEVGVFRSYAEVVIHLYRTTQACQRTLMPAR